MSAPRTAALSSALAIRTPWKLILAYLPMLLLTAMMMTGGRPISPDPLEWIPLAISFLFFNILFFLMLRTGFTDRYRVILFSTMAFLFVIGFIANLIEMRGSMALSESAMAQGETPFCHMVIPMTLIPAALTRTIIFPGHLLGGFAPIAGMVALWIGASLALGRGFCSWGCFYGGLEDGFSRLLKKPLIRRIGRHWTYLPYAILLAVVLLSAATLSPTYCEWLCPFKTVTEYNEVNSFRTLLQAVIMVALFAGLVVVLPILTRKRIQCGLFCPFGAFQSFTNKVSAYDIRIDRTKCVDCGKCAQVCPTFSLDADSISSGGTRLSCCRCGKCVDACPKQAISFHIKGTEAGASPKWSRLLFLYPAFLFLAVFGGSMVQWGLYRILLLLTTGSMVK